MTEWVDKICHVLEHPQYPHIKSRLIKKDEDGNIIGKCAMGEINCQLRNGKESLGDYWLYDHELKEIGIPTEAIIDENCIFLSDYASTIQLMIIYLNDNCFSYKQISEFLKITFSDWDQYE